MVRVLAREGAMTGRFVLSVEFDVRSMVWGPCGRVLRDKKREVGGLLCGRVGIN